MKKTILYNDFCRNINCEEYIEWNFDGNDGGEFPSQCVSCKLVGQSYDIDKRPENCLHLKEITDFEKLQI